MAAFTQGGRGCPFCQIAQEEIVEETEHFVVKFDCFPVSNGHMLVIPKRHILSLFELSPDEFQDLQSALNQARLVIDGLYEPHGYNIGINDGEAAGQTIMHLHIHLIPRYQGDVSQPAGGIRHLMPNKVPYPPMNGKSL